MDNLWDWLGKTNLQQYFTLRDVSRAEKRWVKAGKPDIEFPQRDVGLFVSDRRRLEAEIAKLNEEWQEEHRLRNEIQGKYEGEAKALKELRQKCKSLAESKVALQQRYNTVHESYTHFSTQNGALQVEITRAKAEAARLQTQLENEVAQNRKVENRLTHLGETNRKLSEALEVWENKNIWKRLLDLFKAVREVRIW